MARLKVFNQVSLDGYFTDAHGDMSWAHKSDPEWQSFTRQNAKGGAVLLFGRVTYEMMASFWPTRAAHKSMPEVADAMNRMQKVVFSRTLEKADWSNTALVKSDPVEAVRAKKQHEKQDLLVMGSGQIVAQLTQAGLIDEYEIVVIPIVLGSGRTLFEGVDHRLELRLSKTRQFSNGNVVLWYEYGRA
ncbi:MAG TPA: dihydrofolate reductase family protein [Burkholderiaceae bacterium]|nr:dihydrofolate reductase family protein [Burkholderiaceae bacterium]